MDLPPILFSPLSRAPVGWDCCPEVSQVNSQNAMPAFELFLNIAGDFFSLSPFLNMCKLPSREAQCWALTSLRNRRAAIARGD